MNTEVAVRLGESAEAFRSLVWPVFEPEFGSVIPVESVTATEFSEALDVRSGIDAWVVSDADGQIRGLASRVQKPKGSPFRSFTIRIKSPGGGLTEIDKRRRALSALGAISPHYICQGYVRDGSLLLAGLARMQDVIAAIDSGNHKPLPPNTDGSQGTAVWWSHLQAVGAPLRIWSAP